MENELKTLHGGRMVSDFDASAVPVNYYLKAVNLRNGIKNGVVSSVLGNTQIPVQLPTGTNHAICDAISTEDHLVYYINYNTNLKHTIVELNTVSNTARVILENLTHTFNTDIFNFSPDTEISSARIIDGGDVDNDGYKTNKLLLFVYKGSEPRCINLARITPIPITGSTTVSVSGGKNVLSNGSIKVFENAKYVRAGYGSPWVKIDTIVNNEIKLVDSTIPVGVYSNIEYSFYGNIRLEETLLIKAPPLVPVTSEFFTDSSFTSNNVRDLFQFIYSYEYTDYERSV